jgi:RecB family exonuclease
MAALAAVPIPMQDTDVAQVLSPSQITTHSNCSYQWYCRSVLKLTEPKTGSLTLGSAVDDAINVNMRLKTETNKDLPIEDVLTEFNAAWDNLQPATEYRDDEDPAALKNQGQGLIELFMEKAAPEIDPIAVQLPVSGVIGGVNVRGYIDLIDRSHKIRDIKTSARKSKAMTGSQLIQLTTYAALSPVPCTGIIVDLLVKTKTPQYVPLAEPVRAEDRRFIENLYPTVQEQMRSGLVTPNRSGSMCSRKYCAHWRLCESEWGGTVKGGEDDA